MGGQINLMKVSKPNKVVYVELTRFDQIKRGTGVNSALANEGGNTLYMHANGTTAAANHVPAWFLPWQDGGSVRMTIPDVNHLPNGQVDSNICFTAAINGCSIFFQGTPRNPTIFHSGGSPGLATGRETADFWQAVMDEFVAQDAALGKNKGTVSSASVDKRMYVAQDGVTATNSLTGRVGKSTNRAVLYEQTLRQRYASGRLRIEEVFPWGCVLGRRDHTGNWKFYLQENATVLYHQFSRKQMLLGGGGTFNGGSYTQGATSVPLHFREVFPGGDQQVTIRRKLPTIS